MTIDHNVLFPDPATLISRRWFKDGGTYTGIATPVGANYIRMAALGSGGEGQDLGGDGAFAFRKLQTFAGELWTVQVGLTRTAGNPGNSVVTRVSDGLVVCLADRGHGSGRIDGQAANCIGDFAESGQYPTQSGGDSTFARQLIGQGGRWAANNYSRASGPGGGGLGLLGGAAAAHAAGQGVVVLEWYFGDPGF